MSTEGQNCNRNPTHFSLHGLKPLPNFRRTAPMNKNNPHKNQIAEAEGPPYSKSFLSNFRALMSTLYNYAT